MQDIIICMFVFKLVRLQKIALGLHQGVCSEATEWIDWMKCVISERTAYTVSINKLMCAPSLPIGKKRAMIALTSPQQLNLDDIVKVPGF